MGSQRQHWSLLLWPRETFSPLEAAVQVESMTRRLEEEDIARLEVGGPGLLFRYMGIVPILGLGLLINESSASKKLQFIPKKCKFIKLGKNKNASLPNKFEVNSWNIQYDIDETLVETEGERIKMDEVHGMKYLGFVISRDASNVANT